MSAEQFDVVVIGGGPAGSATGAYLGRAGLKCLILEGEKFPRPHVGESLVPAATRVFKDLGLLGKLDKGGFPRKFGAVWTADENRPAYNHDWEGLSPECAADIRFEEREQEGVDRNYTYHVDRGAFDLLLLEHAEELGATARQECRVTNVNMDDPNAPVVTYRAGNNGRGEHEIKARLVVDASGRNTFLGRQMKLRIVDDVFDQFACHTWFNNYDRSALDDEGGHADYIFIHFLPITNSWIWQIPITETITSIGVVTQKKNFAKSRQSREDFFWECISSRPRLFYALKAAEQMRPLTEEGDYSYSMRKIAGDGFLLVGDAGRFVDPIFSSGVSIALNGARLASADIIKAAEHGGPFKEEDFANYVTMQRRGTRNWYEFIKVYYRLNVLFTACITNPKYRLDIISLLQGDVWDEEEPPVLGAMRRMVAQVEQNPNHVWHDLLGELTSNAFAPVF